MNDKDFLGRGWNFPPEFRNDSPGSRMALNEEDIRQSLMILLSTRSGERFNRREYGCGLYEFASEPINETLLNRMKNKIEKSILLFEPRINLTDIQFDRSREKDGVILISLNYVICLTRTNDSLIYPFYIMDNQ